MIKWKVMAIIALVLLVVAGAGFGYLVPRWQVAVTDLEAAEDAVSTAQGDLVVLNEQLVDVQGRLEGVQGQLEDVRGRYPLRNFGSVGQLEDWAGDHLEYYSYTDSLAEFNAACDVASKAQSEGLLVWVDYDVIGDFTYTWCLAFVGSSLYFWCPHASYYDGVDDVVGFYRLSD